MSANFPTSDPITLANLRMVAEERERARAQWGDRHDDEMGRNHLLDLVCDRTIGMRLRSDRDPGTSDLEKAAKVAGIMLAFMDRCVRDATGAAGEGKDTD